MKGCSAGLSSDHATSTSANQGSSVSFDGTLEPGGTDAGLGQDDGRAESTTMAGISRIAGNQSIRSSDAETGIARIFDADKVQKEINAQTQITQMFGQQASKALGDYKSNRLEEATDLRLQARTETDPERILQLEAQASALESQLGSQGTLRLAAHTLIGGLTGAFSGAAGALAGTFSAPVITEKLRLTGVDDSLATTLTALASTAAGALAGGTPGAQTAFNELANNYLYHYKGRIIAYDIKNNDIVIDLSDQGLQRLCGGKSRDSSPIRGRNRQTGLTNPCHRFIRPPDDRQFDT